MLTLVFHKFGEETIMSVNEEKLNQLLGQFVADFGATLHAGLVVIGEVTHQDIGVDCDHWVFCCSRQSWRMSSDIPWSISSMVLAGPV